MTVFQRQILNRTRPTSSWSDELLTIESAGASGSDSFFPTASRGPCDFCILFAEASHSDFVHNDMRGRKRFKHTLASRPFFAWRFQLNQGALPPVEIDRACAAKRKQSP